MTKSYSNLEEFLGGYYHQDWALDASDSVEVAISYLSEWPRDDALLCLSELSSLLSQSTEIELVDAVSGMGCSFLPASEGYSSTSEWLRAIETIMQAKLSASRRSEPG